MSSKFDTSAPPFRPTVKDAGPPAPKLSTRASARRSKGCQKQSARIMTGENGGRRFHEQRSQKPSTRSNKMTNKNRDESPYDRLASGVQAPDNITYINTSCHFVVDKNCHVHQLCSNPNAKVPQRNILQVIRPPSSCPICLEECPEAPRMLDCGHVMCYPCLLRYEKSIDDDTDTYAYKECPLCFEEIRSSSLLPVKFQNHDLDAPKVGHDSVFRLMFRPMGSLLAAPLDTANSLQQKIVEGGDLPTLNNSDLGLYSRVMIASNEYAIEEYSKEIASLKESKKRNIELFGDEGTFHDKSISLILHEIRRLRAGVGLENGMDELSLERKSDDSKYHGHSSNTHKEKYHEEDDYIDKLTDPQKYADNNAFFFYQTGFGLSTKYFLSPLDVKVLKAEYGSFSSFPSFVIAKVQRIISGKYVNDELTKRIKYLGHLPVHTSIGFIECDWKGVISEDVLKQFANELDSRRNRYNDKIRKEDRERRQFEAKERSKLLEETDMELETYSKRVSVARNASIGPALLENRVSEDILTKPTVWGTRVIAETEENDESEEEEEIFKVMEQGRNGKKGRKKLVLYANRGII